LAGFDGVRAECRQLRAGNSASITNRAGHRHLLRLSGFPEILLVLDPRPRRLLQRCGSLLLTPLLFLPKHGG